MVEIFLIQLLATALGAVSTALADWWYYRAHIGLRLHALWVAASISVICLPVLGWTSYVFLGSGFAGQLATAILLSSIFFFVYRNSPKPRSMQKPGSQPSPRPSSAAAPPASKFRS
jgi:hypothetical protein